MVPQSTLPDYSVLLGAYAALSNVTRLVIDSVNFSAFDVFYHGRTLRSQFPKLDELIVLNSSLSKLDVSLFSLKTLVVRNSPRLDRALPCNITVAVRSFCRFVAH